MFEIFKEGKVYELLLITESNVTPVGVVRKGRSLFFKLFPGRSFRDILKNPQVSIQLTNDAELLVKTALNRPVHLKFERQSGYRWISGLPGFYGRVEIEKKVWKDELGETEVLECKFLPEGVIKGKLEARPFSRADCVLVEMAVLFTRYLLKPRESIKSRILELDNLYAHLGGVSDVADYMVSVLTKRDQNRH
ncbi:DUF447 domain-containing protein [Thermococcus sp.]